MPVTVPHGRDAVDEPAPALATEVLVCGTSVPAALLAAALAEGGLQVVLLRDPRGTRRASDASTIPYAAELALLIADRFALPEVASLALFEHVPPAVAGPSGEKTSLGFCHHRRNRAHDPAEALQFQVPGEHAEWQPDRAALDAWAAGVAAAHGATVIDSAAHDLKADVAGVRVRAGLDGRAIVADLLIDATAGVAADEPAIRPRVLSADLTEVEPFERVLGGQHGDVRPWSAGTLTHTFAGGYLQVCHHGAQRSAGVTLVLAGDRGDLELDGPEQVAVVLAEFPHLRAQLVGSRPVAGWEDSWAAAEVLNAEGPRVLMLDAGGGRHPLLGRELTLGFEAVLAAGGALLGADARAGGQDAAISAASKRIVALTEHEDRHAEALLSSSHDFDLVNALLRVWLLESIVRALALKRARLDAIASGDFDALDRGAGAFWFRVPCGLQGLVEASLADVKAATRRSVPRSVAAQRIFGRLRRSRVTPPLFDFGNPDARIYAFTAVRRMRMLAWVTLRAPADFRGLLTRENVSAARPSSGGARSNTAPLPSP